jgi:hypothetical protein
LEISLKGSSKLARFLNDEAVCEKDYSEFDAVAFVKKFFGDWEGVFVGDEMIDLESTVELISITR